jgi:hypothetical protein
MQSDGSQEEGLGADQSPIGRPSSARDIVAAWLVCALFGAAAVALTGTPRIDRVGTVGSGHAAALHAFEPGEEPCQRRAQVVRDVLGHPLHLVHQPLDLVEHAVDDVDQAGEIAAASAARQVLREVAADHPPDRAGSNAKRRFK